MSQENFIQLSELNEQIKDALLDKFPQAIWLVAEIYSMNVNKAGHCYLELAEKAEKSKKIVAKSRGVIWAYQFNMLKTYFEQTTGQYFEAGIKVLVKAMPQFHELFGYSVIITDIEPSFTLGDLAVQRQKTIDELKETGVFELNKEQFLTDLPKSLAVISSNSAAGYGDFINQIEQNPYQYAIKIELFDALMQGNDCAQSVMNALEQIYEREEEFDAVIIIRGGGSKADLSCFDDFDLAFHVCHFPLPVLSGIGHERDESILDLVAHTSLKTPTAVADFLLSKYIHIESLLNTYKEQIERISKAKLVSETTVLSQINNSLFKIVYERIGLEKQNLAINEQALRKEIVKFNVAQDFDLQNKKSLLNNYVANYLDKAKEKIDSFPEKIRQNAVIILKENTNKLQQYEKQVQLQDPNLLLKKGYSITLKNGKLLQSINDVNANDEILTILSNGKLKSSVKK